MNEALLGRWEPVYRSRLHYLVTWATRGRKPVLKERHAVKLHELIPPLCEEGNLSLVELAVGVDHVHVLFGLKPSHSVASAVRDLKGRTAVALMNQFPELRVWLGGNLLWDDRYAVETVSHARLEALQQKLRTFHTTQDLAEAS
jgi:putative transposase